MNEDAIMVAEGKETVGQMFDQMNETFRTVVDSGRKTQETFFRTMTDTCKNPLGWDQLMSRGEKMARDFMPFLGKNVEALAETFDAGFRANMDVFRAAADATMKSEDNMDFYRRSRQFWDAAFGAFRTGFEALNKASVRAMDNWAGFCRSSCCEDATSRPTSRPAKA
jgi:hypothetical protein